MTHPIPLSVLDLAIVNQDATTASALADTTKLAQAAEQLGYTRFWVAEHHNMPTIASTNPPVLIAHLAALTDHIHIGSGGVMLPNHPPLVVAEQFAILEALHPGRIDLGIGRAPGTDPATAAALRRTTAGLGAEEFPRHLLDLMGLLGDPRTANGLWQRFSATPAPSSVPSIILLGSSDYSAQLAGQLGLPFAFAHHFDTGGTLFAIELYRQSFRPSAMLEQPYLIVTANVLVADTAEEADYLATPGMLVRYAIRTGRLTPILSPAAAATHPDLPAARQMPSSSIIGDPASVRTKLEALANETAASELMVTNFAYSVDERIHSLELLAKLWGLSPR